MDATATSTESTERKLSDRSLVWLDIAAGLIGAMLGHDLGKQIWKLAQSAKKSILQPGEASAQHTTTSTTAASTSSFVEIDPTLHSSFMGLGQADEALTGMTAGECFRKFAVRIAQSTGNQTLLEKRRFRQLETTFGYIAELNQGQIDNLREAVGKLKTAELQTQFWQNLTMASRTHKNFMNFMKTMGIVRDESMFVKEIGKGIADGLNGATKRYEKKYKAESARLSRATKAALRRP